MTAQTDIIDLQGLRLPADGPFLRRHQRAPERRTENYNDQYDRRTLFYDCVAQPDLGRILITAPPFLNLAPLVKEHLSRSGRTLRPRLRETAKYAQAVLPFAPDPLELRIGAQVTTVAPREDISARFCALNCAVTMNMDNPLAWIADWASYHARAHRLEAVLIFDNGSRSYTAESLAARLADIPGLRQVVVARTPYPYGTTDKLAPGEPRSNFLQPAMLNLARTDLLRRARAVLNADIDELVMARDGGSVFDSAAASFAGAARLPVYWAYPAPGTEGPAAQSAHRFRTDPRTRTPRKWCAVPDGWLSRLGGWHVHHLGGELFKLLPEATAFEVAHCRAASTGWNPRKARHRGAEQLREDPELVAMMASLDGASASAAT